MDKKRRDVGKFRHRVKLYTATRVDDGGGGAARSDPSVGTLIDEVWADVAPMTAREQYWSQQLVENVTHTVKIRWRSEVLDGQFVVWGAVQLYIITAVDPTNLGEFLFLACREGGPN